MNLPIKILNEDIRVVPEGARADAATPVGRGALSLLVRDVHRSFARSLQARITAHGVSIGQWFFLRALWAEDGLTQRELSQRVGMMEPTTVTALNGMERCGLVKRVRNPRDRRKMNIFLTEKGAMLREPLLGVAEEVDALAVIGLSGCDLAAAHEVLRRIAENLAIFGPLPPVLEEE